jgi:Prp8 binding protein
VLQSPVMELTGHSGEVFAARFDPTGRMIASGSMDRSICQPPPRDAAVYAD